MAEHRGNLNTVMRMTKGNQKDFELMSIALITGSAGLIGSEAARYFASMGMNVVGIDNDMRRYFFGDDASTHWQKEGLKKELGKRYSHFEIDIRDSEQLENIFRRHTHNISLIIHAASQPSHDWAVKEPKTDFSVNAVGTLNLLELFRNHCPDAVFIFVSTNKVYGDMPNYLPLVELETRWEIYPAHTYKNGIREEMTIDQSLHSRFGASKLAADVLVQEYGRYFKLNTATFRGGCITGPNHSGAKLHGFLAYLMRCAVTDEPYTVFGYKCKQVRDNIHSADLIRAFHEYFRFPRRGEVYNIGGGRFSNCSMLEAIAMCEKISDRKLNWKYSEDNRIGDHIWWISDNGKFKSHYPDWVQQYDIEAILEEIYKGNRQRWLRKG